MLVNRSISTLIPTIIRPMPVVAKNVRNVRPAARIAADVVAAVAPVACIIALKALSVPVPVTRRALKSNN